MYLIDNIRFRYRTDWILSQLNLSVEDGSFIGLIGPNGSGKTTLLKILSGMLLPQIGTVVLQGRNLALWHRQERARSVAFVPQESHFLYPYTVLSMVLLGRAPYTSWLGFDQPQDVAIAQRALDRVGMQHLAERSIQSLSGGERQMVLIARALAQHPKVLLLDEPTAFLDLSHQVEIYDILRQLNKTEGLTIVSVSHDLNLAAQYCDSLILIKEGKIKAAGEPSAILSEELIQQVYGCRTLIDRHPTTGRPRITLIPEGTA